MILNIAQYTNFSPMKRKSDIFVAESSGYVYHTTLKPMSLNYCTGIVECTTNMKNSIHNKAIAVIIVAAMNMTVYNDKQSSNLPLYFQIAPFIQGIFYASTYTA